MNRDENAALNILARGREIRRGPPEFRPAEEETTTPPLEAVQVYPMKQEVSLLVGGSSRLLGPKYLLSSICLNG